MEEHYYDSLCEEIKKNPIPEQALKSLIEYYKLRIYKVAHGKENTEQKKKEINEIIKKIKNEIMKIRKEVLRESIKGKIEELVYEIFNEFQIKDVGR